MQESPAEHAPSGDENGIPAEQAPEPAGDGHEGADEPYLTDDRFHTDDPAGVRRIEDTFMDSGRQSSETGEWRHEQVRREALAKRDEFHPGMSDDGALAVHAYTRHEMVGPLNRALRLGSPELAHLAPQAGALVSGLNELPPHVGTVSRRIDFQRDASRLQAFLGRFHQDAHITEPSFLSSSKVDATHPRSTFAGEVEMRIESKTGRDVESMASIGHEREVLFKAGTQFEITHVEKGPGHPEHPDFKNEPGARDKPQWIVHAEEIAPGDPRHLGEADARQAIEDRRAAERADEERFEREEAERDAQFQAEYPHLKPSGDVFKLLSGDDPADAPPPPVRHEPATKAPEGGWSQLAQPLTPGGEPVLHAGSVETPQQHARLVRDALPELSGVNSRNHYSPDALENGYRTNSAESMVAFDRRMNGEDVVAGPARGESLSGAWSSRGSFDDVARDLGERPVGARSAVAFEDSTGERLVAAVHTEHGVLFADPVTGRLAELPHDVAGLRELPLGQQETIADRLSPAPERVPHDEGYLFDDGHRGTPADHGSIRRAVGDEGIYQQVHDRALARRDAAGMPMTDEGAVAVHGYTRGEYAYDVNEALRRGPGHPGFDLAQANARAITDGLNQVPRTSGETIRAFDVSGDPRLAELVAGPYNRGEVVVEPSFSSASIKTGELSTSKFGDDVELHVRSGNLRDISKLAENPSERESLSPPGTQLLVHDKRLVITPEGRRKWVIEAEEIGPGHPRYLDPETAQRKMAERRAENDHNAAEFERRKQAALMERLGGFGEAEHAAPQHPKVSDVLDHQEAPVEPTPQPDYGKLARATNPPAEPAIHADAATPAERAAYVQDRHPHLGEVNPGFHQPGALENGYLSNCTRGPAAYWDRLHGGNATAEPILFHEMGTRGTLEHIEGRFGETFSARGSYDDVIREMREMPLDHHAVIAVKYEGPNGAEYGHVAMVVHTRDGVAFIDPQSGDLMHLPQPPKDIKLLHVGTPGTEHVQVETTTEHGGYGHAPQSRLDELLAQPRVAEALAGATTDLVVKDHEGNPQNLGPVGEFVRTRLAAHPDLVALLHDPANEFLTRSLLRKPETMASLLLHDEAIPILTDAVHEVHDPDPDAAPVGPDADPTPLTPDQAETSGEVLDQAEGHPQEHRRQAPFDLGRAGDEAYTREYLAERYAEAARADAKLKEILPPLAEDTGGHAGFRPGPKSEGRAMDKINTNYDGDASRLVDLAGAMIQFDRVQDAYAALARIADHPDLEIVDFDDRFANPAPAGYRDLQMSVRINGHVAELRLHLKALDDVSAYEHSLYEVRRDLKALAKAEGRTYTGEERALIDGLIKRERELFRDALQGSL